MKSILHVFGIKEYDTAIQYKLSIASLQNNCVIKNNFMFLNYTSSYV